MRNFKTIILAAITLFGTTLVSCSNDDDDDNPRSTAGIYKGLHTGYLTNDGIDNVFAFPNNPEAQVTLTDNGDGTVTIQTPSYALGESESALVYTGYDLTVKLNNNGTFNEDYPNNIKSISSRGNVIEFAAHFDGHVDVESKQLTYELTLNHASSHIILTFSGKK